jgi:hypothetical protein
LPIPIVFPERAVAKQSGIKRISWIRIRRGDHAGDLPSSKMPLPAEQFPAFSFETMDKAWICQAQ